MLRSSQNCSTIFMHLDLLPCYTVGILLVRIHIQVCTIPFRQYFLQSFV